MDGVTGHNPNEPLRWWSTARRADPELRMSVRRSDMSDMRLQPFAVLQPFCRPHVALTVLTVVSGNGDDDIPRHPLGSWGAGFLRGHPTARGEVLNSALSRKASVACLCDRCGFRIARKHAGLGHRYGFIQQDDGQVQSQSLSQTWQHHQSETILVPTPLSLSAFCLFPLLPPTLCEAFPSPSRFSGLVVSHSWTAGLCPARKCL